MAARLFEIIQFLDNSGNPLSGGKIHTFDGGTTTPRATFTDSTAGTPHANPVILDSSGRAQIWLQGDPYRLRVDDSADVTIITLDNIPATSTLSGNPLATRAQVQTTLSATNGAALLTASSLVPANSRTLGSYVENLVALGTSNGLTGYDVGSHGIEDRWGANVVLTLGNKTTMGNFPLADQPHSASAQDITIAAIDGTFDGTGSIQITVEYEQGTSP